jgi:uncharacterized coiled-coil protein SlyX
MSMNDTNHEGRFIMVENRIQNIEKSIDKLDNELFRDNGRFDKIDKQLVEMNDRLGKIMIIVGVLGAGAGGATASIVQSILGG